MGRGSLYGPILPGENPEDFHDDFFDNPMELGANRSFAAGTFRDGTVLEYGQPVLEINFVRGLHYYERHRENITGMFMELAQNLRDVAEEAPLPEIIVGHTYTKAARFAIAAYGFQQMKMASLPDGLIVDPFSHQLDRLRHTIEENSRGRGEPTAIAMRTVDFLDRFDAQIPDYM